MRMLARVAVILTVAAAGLPAPRTAAAPGSASDVVRHFFDALLANMKNAKALGAKGRYEKLEPVVKATFDIPFMTRMSVGPSWGRLTADEKRRATAAFRRYVTATYATQFDGYSGETFEVLGEEGVRHGTIVRTRIVPPDGDKVAINYALHDNDTAWQIRDVYLTGTISELATRRSDFASTLHDGGIDALITRLNKKADDLLG
jgi:phospholipid transport system substrate-binding protein